MENYGLHNEGVSMCTINARKQVETFPFKPRCHLAQKQSFYPSDTKGQLE